MEGIGEMAIECEKREGGDGKRKRFRLGLKLDIFSKYIKTV